MWRGLFEGFEKSIEGTRREHMDLIDYVDLIGCLIWLESCSFYEFPYIVDSCIRCCIDLDDIEEGIIIEGETVRTDMAGISSFLFETVQGFCEDASARRLARST